MPKETRIIRWGEWRKFPVFRCWLSDSIPGILLAALSRRRSGSGFGLRFSVLYQFPETIGTIGGAALPARDLSELRRRVMAAQQRLSQNLSGDRFFSLSSATWRRGLGGGGAFLLGIPLSSILSPLVPHGARRKQN